MYHLTCTSDRGSDAGQAPNIGGITQQLADHLAQHLTDHGPVRWTITTPAGQEYPGTVSTPYPDTAGTITSVIDDIYAMLAHDAAKTADRAAGRR